MSADEVVERLDPFEDGRSELAAGGPPAAVEQLALHRGRERFDHRVVDGAGDAAHRAEPASCAESDERIELLHAHVEEVGQALRDLGSEFDRNRSDVGQRLGEVRTELSTDVAGLGKVARVDGRALPPIAVGLLLAGLPAELACVPAVG